MIFAMMLAAAGVQDAPPVDKASAPAGSSVSAPSTDSDGTQRWSILVDPCASVTGNPVRDEIVVCGSTVAASPRLPLPGERGPPDRPMPSNPYLSGMGALEASVAPCAARSQGCTTGVDLFGGGTALVRLIGKVIDPDSCCEAQGEATNPFALAGDIGSGVAGLFRGKPDKSNRIPIPLEDPVSGAGPIP
ncbi:hypothetical protein [Sphingomonas sp. G-3-2-10]|uniref:hypothetical protein n=1 Tax=Sphingomonas sp. G-3-2-10 TaxID=2728838 RepID=UPI00146D0422|nr:hypothetical protein [Sphingomonas sp. G-3-2-10]NML07572.1 hypothetical protein [Sphingomonas sp. G-3-2-10]